MTPYKETAEERAWVLELDLQHLSDMEKIQLHDLKAKACRAWAEKEMQILQDRKTKEAAI